uniref:Uncharacterized protein n=1 Tax=Meloidogyne enterolobii TaxID=390850 RepID=A0A6V7WJT0_MELEN|nr:unnamed protein product [Meloidogyne enterolobii]
MCSGDILILSNIINFYLPILFPISIILVFNSFGYSTFCFSNNSILYPIKLISVQ